MNNKVCATAKVPQFNFPDLKNQRVIVTGATSGIGRACAIAFGEAGARVAVDHTADSKDDAAVVVSEIEAAGGTALAVLCDVSDENQVERMFAKVVAEWDSIDILLANAGLQQDAALVDMTLDQWNTVISVNLTGQFLCARAAAREFLQRGIDPAISQAAGKIICMSSVHEIIPWAGHVNYAASKGGIDMLSKSMAQELAPHHIRVNSICPGAIRTPINTAAWKTSEAYEELMKLVPYNRIGEPSDIARAALWLASDQSDYVTGISLFVDGGMTLFPGFASGG
uniref:glucose 1-dehydrogenase n=1 Tax=Pararhizobium sp. IMCC3301 TaxID=3067904 RepID=UPI0027414C9C|nr:glucose 1-dehydrogenase [Pararhizobium sp. IMCC3301]